MQSVTVLSSSLYSIIPHELIEVIFVYFNKLLILIVIKCDSHNIYLSTALYLQEVIIHDCLPFRNHNFPHIVLINKHQNSVS